MGTLRKNQGEILKIKNTVAEMMTAFDRFISMAKERISEFEDMSILQKLKHEEKKDWKKWNRKSRSCGIITSIMRIPEGEERKEPKKYLK